MIYNILIYFADYFRDMRTLLAVFTLFIYSCKSVNSDNSIISDKVKLKTGPWVFSFDCGEEIIPFNLFFSIKNDDTLFYVRNAEEMIEVSEFELRGDSLFLTMPVFGTKLNARVYSDSLIKGIWYNSTKSKDYTLSFVGKWGSEMRFNEQTLIPPSDYSGTWEVVFSPDSAKPCKAMGVFEQNNEKIKGTFLTETGDYRFLEGIVNGREMLLSTFDGAHAYLFKSQMDSGGNISGLFWSGNHWKESWIGIKNSDFVLSHPDSISYVINSEKILNLSFVDLSNKPMRIGELRNDNNVLILQIMGTWCPNCADESRDFSKFYTQYKSKGLDIIAVAYERSDVFQEALLNINRFKRNIDVPYPFLYGGKASKAKTSKDFNMLNGIFSFPTAIFIDRAGKIRKIHSGYYGPGTGIYHDKFKEQTQIFIEKLLNEPVSN